MQINIEKFAFHVMFSVMLLNSSAAMASLIITKFDLTPLTVAIPSEDDKVFHFNASVQTKNDANPNKVIQLLDYTFTLKETDLLESTADAVITTQGIINNFVAPGGVYTIQIAADVTSGVLKDKAGNFGELGEWEFNWGSLIDVRWQYAEPDPTPEIVRDTFVPEPATFWLVVIGATAWGIMRLSKNPNFHERSEFAAS